MADLLVVLASVGVLATTFLVVLPAAIDAAPADDGPASRTAEDPEHQRTIDLLAALIGRSRAVLAVHPRDETPFVEVVLWLEDVTQPGVVNADEIGIIGHSEISQVVTFSGRADEKTPGRAFTHEELADRSFGRRWRSGPDVRRRVIARGVSDLAVVPFVEANRRSRIQIELTWPSGSVDRPDKASAVVDAPDAP